MHTSLPLPRHWEARERENFPLAPPKDSVGNVAVSCERLAPNRFLYRHLRSIATLLAQQIVSKHFQSAFRGPPPPYHAYHRVRRHNGEEPNIYPHTTSQIFTLQEPASASVRTKEAHIPPLTSVEKTICSGQDIVQLRSYTKTRGFLRRYARAVKEVVRWRDYGVFSELRMVCTVSGYGMCFELALLWLIFERLHPQEGQTEGAVGGLKYKAVRKGKT